jgi:hypothetical protein
MTFANARASGFRRIIEAGDKAGRQARSGRTRAEARRRLGLTRDGDCQDSRSGDRPDGRGAGQVGASARGTAHARAFGRRAGCRGRGGVLDLGLGLGPGFFIRLAATRRARAVNRAGALMLRTRRGRTGPGQEDRQNQPGRPQAGAEDCGCRDAWHGHATMFSRAGGEVKVSGARGQDNCRVRRAESKGHPLPGVKPIRGWAISRISFRILREHPSRPVYNSSSRKAGQVPGSHGMAVLLVLLGCWGIRLDH